jgi:hypothetical protein
MLKIEDLNKISVEINFPSDFKVEATTPFHKLSLDKITVGSFPHISITTRGIVDKLLKDLPYISLMGRNSTFTIDHDGIDVTISPKGGGIFSLDGDDDEKKFSSRDYEKISGDANYLFGSILGSLNLSDKVLQTTIRLEFSKKGIFKKSFTSKINKNEFKSVNLKDVPQISFSVEDREEKSSKTEVVYEFLREDLDEINVIKKFTKVFSPVDISGTIDKFLGNLNSVLKDW